VKDYEPPVAVFSGRDGLEGVRHVVRGAASKLAPGGWLIMEFGCGQDDLVTAIVRQTPGIELVKVRHDIQDIPRTVVCRHTGRDAGEGAPDRS
jgi:release factor glutamine methyltransferase